MKSSTKNYKKEFSYFFFFFFYESLKEIHRDLKNMSVQIRVWNLPLRFESKSIFEIMNEEYPIVEMGKTFMIIEVPKAEAYLIISIFNSRHVLDGKYIGLRFENKGPVCKRVFSFREAKFKTLLRAGFFLDFRNFIFTSSAARIEKCL